MIHIGTVQLNGREYSLELNRPNQEQNDSKVEPTGAVGRRNLPPARSEILRLNLNRKPVGAQHAGHPIVNIRTLEDFRRQFRRTEQTQALATKPKWTIDRERAVKLVSRFLSWCFPVREFKSPLQRILYLSIEEPKTKYPRRFLLP